jgi:uncharacterized protein YecE (DUF72 family)
MAIYIGCAGWNLRKEFAAEFPLVGTHLQRYAARLSAVEINSSFYRSHQTKTYRRWAASTPDGFRFAVKLPKQITHFSRLGAVDQPVEPLLEQFLGEVSGLGEKLGPILVQLPPSLAFESPTVERFFGALRQRTTGAVICEPRHPTWFEQEAEALLKEFAIDRVAADPAILPAAAVPGGCGHNGYFRWHGSPRMYYSAYNEQALGELATRLLALAEHGNGAWCIFDNTADGAALRNALSLVELLDRSPPPTLGQ